MPVDPNAMAALEAFAQPAPTGGVSPVEAVVCQVCGTPVDTITGAPVDAGPPPPGAGGPPPAGPLPGM